MLIGWDHGAYGIWWVLNKEEKEAPAPPGHWSGTPPSSWHDRPGPWSDRLSGELLDCLQAWNDACAADGAEARRCKSADASLRYRSRMSWELTAGKCSTRWTARCSGCIRRAVGRSNRGSKNCWVTTAGRQRNERVSE